MIHCHYHVVGRLTLSHIDEICPLAIPSHISTISMHITSYVKINWDLLKLLSWKENMNVSLADNSVKIDKIWPLAIPKQITIWMHTPSFLKIHWHLLKLWSRNENIDVLREDNYQALHHAHHCTYMKQGHNSVKKWNHREGALVFP